MAVIQQAKAQHSKVTVAMDSECVYLGCRGLARYRLNAWVSCTVTVSNVGLWIQLLELIGSSKTSFRWLKIPSHTGLHGNKEVADQLANDGRLASPLYASFEALACSAADWTGLDHANPPSQANIVD